MTVRVVRKRDGRLATFKRGKITKAIFKAAYKVGELDMDIDDTLVVAIINKLHETDIDISESEGMIQLSQEIYDIIDDYDIEEQDIASISTLINMLSISDDLANQVVDTFDELGIEEPTVDEIQNTVERLLIKNGHAKTAKVFIVYSARRQDRREMNNTLMKTFEDLTFADSKHVEVKRENANIDGDSAMGTMLRYGSEGAKQFNLARLISDDIADAHRDGDIHIHDLDFYSLCETCCQIDLDKLFTGGFNTGHGYLREPSEIRSYAALACIAIQSNQNDMHGGQSIPAFDYYMAKGVAKTYVKELVRIIEVKYVDNEEDKQWLLEIKNSLKKYREEKGLIMNEEGYKFIRNVLNIYLDVSASEIDILLKKTSTYTEDATYQAMESLVHNLNSMHSRAGAQVPFSSLNYGTDISEEGRMVVRNILLTTEAGLGNGETPIFPIQIYKLKDGINTKEGDINYDLFKLACRVSAKRLFPNFSNVDAPYNSQYYKEGRPETEIAYMGCRTRTIGNVYNPENEVVTSRGNLSFTTINLPRIGLTVGEGNIEEFYSLLDEKLELVTRQLLERYEVQCRKHPKNYPFLMGQGVWVGSDKLGPNDDMSEILKEGTLSIGYIGLAETLVALTGKHHGESVESQLLGINIIKRMRTFCDRKAEEYKMNFTLLATPAEGLSGRFVKIDKVKFGIVKGVTDRDYYTNSHHVPVYYEISAFKKIRLEAPYHELANAGHIAYVEIDGDPLKNLEAFESLVLYMHDMNIGYGAINHPVDRDPVCGYTGIIDDVCPRCGRLDGEPMTMDIWNRVKGYTHNADNCGTCGNPDEENDRLTNWIDN